MYAVVVRGRGIPSAVSQHPPPQQVFRSRAFYFPPMEILVPRECVCMCINVPYHMHTHTHTRTRTARVYVRLYIYVYIYICVYCIFTKSQLGHAV